MQIVTTYWQVYLVLAASALAAFWGGWGSCLIANPGLRARHRRARARARAAAPAPALADAVTEAWAANLAAAGRPHSVWPLARAQALVTSVLSALGGVAAARNAWEAGTDLEHRDAA